MDLLRVAKKRFKDVIQKLPLNLKNDKTSFDARYLSSQLIKCNWSLNKEDEKKLFSKDTYSLSLRLYDIKPNEDDNNTCIMKEIQIKKSSKECFVKPLLANGNLLIELGFRKPYDKWFLLASRLLRLGNRVDYLIEIYPDDSWFYAKSANEMSDNIHEKAYQLSRSFVSGGSEKIHEI